MERRFSRASGLVIAMAACLAACGGGGSGGEGGSGNGGGSGGAGGGGDGGGGGSGSGGAGGMAGSACTAEQNAVVQASWPWLGFEDATPDLSSGAQATVAVVDAFGMELAFDAGGMPARLAWQGPDLGEVFAVGDMVTAKQEGQSYLVSGTKGQAVVMRYANADVPAALPALPGGPSLVLSLACVSEQPKDCPEADRRTLYSISALLGDDGGQIPSGETMQVGSWKIHHVKTMYIELHKSPECTPERFFDGMVQALEVKP
ncbi:hypothetical protein [Polyangium spumosum]|uniref:Secreted protein n=1 Tax=Polyangium spumosum TaxID=889282 RepID=A0A6N7Q458_9BACT|nr:hypothetical protein [Polyangium spumosum]MRG97996.1 hypothetical protein [Polyangium spumosum]